jgi:Helix-turn-helix of DDE superfamily endonuclease
MNDKHALLIENPKYCKRLFGVKYEIFEHILQKVQNNIDNFLIENPLSNRGIPADFSISNQVLLTLEYLRQYPTFLSLAFSYGISESYANKIYHKIRPILAETVGLKNPEKLKFKHIQKVIVDVTVQPIERPGIGQEKYYNRYKKNISSKFN